MTITQRGKGWLATVTHQGTRSRQQFSTYAEATQWEASAKHAVLLGKPMPKVNRVNQIGWTLGDAADRTFRTRWKGKASEKTNLVNMRHHLNYYGDKMPLSDLNTEQVDDLILDLRERRYSGATINRILMNLSRCLRTAREYGKMDHKPTINREPEGEHRLRWLTTSECDRIIRSAQELGYLHVRDAIVVALDTGVRRGELFRITPADITRQGLGVWVTKNMKGRVIPLTKRARAVLESRVSQCEHRTSLVFPQTNINRTPWYRVKYHADMDKDVVWHTLRHTFASRLVQRDVPIQHVQKLMGHKTIQVTMRYAKIADSNLGNAIAALDNISTV